MPAVPGVGLRAAVVGAHVVALPAEGLDAGGLGGAVVAAEDQQGVVREAVLLEGGADGADGGIGLHDEVGVVTQAALALPLLGGQDRGMW